MNNQKIQSFLLQNGKYFPKSKLNYLGRKLESISVREYELNKNFHNPIHFTLIFWLFWPFQLFDRLILKDWIWGLIKLLIPVVCSLLIFINLQNIMLTGINLRGYDLTTTVSVLMITLWGLWTLIDGFTIYRRTKYANLKSIEKSITKLSDYRSNDNRTTKYINKKENTNRLKNGLTINEMYRKK